MVRRFIDSDRLTALVSEEFRSQVGQAHERAESRLQRLQCRPRLADSQQPQLPVPEHERRLARGQDADVSGAALPALVQRHL